MGRSLRVASEYIEQVKSALLRNGYPSQQSLATDSGFSLSTVKSFLNGKPVDYLIFTELSDKLGFDWQKIASKQPQSQPTIQEPSPFITGAPITQPRYFFGREKELKRLFNLLKRHPLQNAAIFGKKRSGKTFSDEDVVWILHHSQRHPLLLQILCQERVFTLEEGENDDSWREEGLKQIQPFTNLLDEKK